MTIARKIRIERHETNSRGLRIVGGTIRIVLLDDADRVLAEYHGVEFIMQEMMLVALGQTREETFVDIESLAT